MEKIYKLSLLLAAFVAISFGLWQCTSAEDITKDLQIVIKNDLIRIPLSLRVIDVNPAPNATSFGPDKVTITVGGPDADKIYTSGIEKLADVGEMRGGLLDIALKKAVKPTAQNPVKFSLTFKSAGFLPTTRSFTITDTMTQMQEIGMLNLSRPPKGVKVVTETVNVGANGLTVDAKVKSDSFSVDIPKGTVFKTASGEVVTGAVTMQFVQFSPNSAAALEAFPGGFSPNNVKDANGKDIGGGSFQTAGFLAVDMKAGDKEVKNFENGELSVSMSISNSLKNPENNGAGIKPGDKIPLWSLDVEKGEWQKEQDLTIGGTAAAPTASWKQKHLSYWNMDWFWNFCAIGKTLNFPTNLPPNWYYVEFVDDITGFVYKRTYHYIDRGRSETLVYVPDIPSPMRLRISNALYGYLSGNDNSPTTGIFAYNTNSFIACGAGTVNLVLSPTPQVSNTPTITIRARGYCPNRPTLLIAPVIAVWCKKAGTSPFNWRYMGVCINGDFTTNMLEKGERYDFMVYNGRQTQIINNGDIPAQFQKIPTESTTNYTYLLPNTPMPDYICNYF